MRRDYFTCVFLGLIAGALAFVCFKPLYFTYNAVIPRDFSLFERFMSVLYTLFFLVFIPFIAAFKKKEWINWGLAAYGLMAFFPIWFYPSAESLIGENASIVSIIGALCLRVIYAVMQAPFAALSRLIGDDAASSVVYWILPVAVVWPVVFRILRFYRRAYLSEQLNPMTAEQAAAATSKKTDAPSKPEVLGTVITAPVTVQTPADITRKSAEANKKKEEPVKVKASKAEEKPAMNEGPAVRRAGVRAPVRPVHIGVGAPEKKPEALEAGSPKDAKPKKDEVIQLGAPKPKSDEAIPMPPPKPKEGEAIHLGAPKPKSTGDAPAGTAAPKDGGQ